MKILKQILCFLLVVCVLLVGIPSQVHAKTTYSEGYFYYQIEDESITITGYFGNRETVVVPSTIAGYPVSKIAQGAFWQTKTVKELHLPDTIMEVESEAIGTHIQVVYDTEKGEIPNEDANDNNNSSNFDVEEVDGVTDPNTDSKEEVESATSKEQGNSNDETNTAQDEGQNSGDDTLDEGAEVDSDKDFVETIEEDETKPNEKHIVVVIGLVAIVLVVVAFLFYRKWRKN